MMTKEQQITLTGSKRIKNVGNIVVPSKPSNGKLHMNNAYSSTLLERFYFKIRLFSNNHPFLTKI